MKKILILLLTITSLSAFSQCATQTTVPPTAFEGKALVANGQFMSYHLNQPILSGLNYQFSLAINQSKFNTCQYVLSTCDVQCLVYLGHDSGDITSSIPDTIRNNYYPFPDTPTAYTCKFIPNDTFSYITLQYVFCYGGYWIGCPDSLFVGSFGASTTQTSIQVLASPCASDTTGAAVVHASGYAPFAYSWNNGTADSVLYNVLAGTYQVTVTDSAGCVTHDTVTINARALPIASITKSGDTLTSVHAVSYQWYLNASAINGATSQCYIPTENGNYYVQIADSACASTPSNVIAISSIVSGIKELADAGIMVYPNPATTTVTVHCNIPSALQIRDLMGREVIAKEIMGDTHLDVSAMAKGVYLIAIRQGENTFSQKLIIQ